MHRRLAHDEGQERTMNRYLLSFLILALFALVPAAQASELGRLFYTPQQRQQLEYLDAHSSEVEGGGRGYLIVNGVVQKQGGNRTVWVNGVPQTAGRGNDQTPASVSVAVPGKKQPVPAKVGQKILLEPPAPDENK